MEYWSTAPIWNCTPRPRGWECFQATHLGDFQGMPPTRKQVAYSGILIYRVANGKIAEQWTEFDLLGFLKQLGAL
jgi:predicted ester cyclase